jgi:hypothetical protein
MGIIHSRLSNAKVKDETDMKLLEEITQKIDNGELFHSVSTTNGMIIQIHNEMSQMKEQIKLSNVKMDKMIKLLETLEVV